MFRASRALSFIATVLTAGMAGAACDKPVYLTIDTGHMEVAPLIADVLKRNGVKATFFLANEKTKTDGSSLDSASDRRSSVREIPS